MSIYCAVIITAVRKRLIRKKEFKQINICLYETVENLQCMSLFASIHNKTVAERETKYSQTFVQQSPFGNGIKVTVIYSAGDGYIQVNFAENIIKATGNFGKLSGDLNIQGDRYIQGSDNTGLTVLLSLETKKETKSNPSVCVGITAYGDFKQDLSRLPEAELSTYLSFLLFLFFFLQNS